MKFEFTVLGFMVLLSIWYLKKMDEAFLETKKLFENSVEMVMVHEDRLARVETAVEDVPEMREDIREIKAILLASGFKVHEER